MDKKVRTAIIYYDLEKKIETEFTVEFLRLIGMLVNKKTQRGKKEKFDVVIKLDKNTKFQYATSSNSSKLKFLEALNSIKEEFYNNPYYDYYEYARLYCIYKVNFVYSKTLERSKVLFPTYEFTMEQSQLKERYEDFKNLLVLRGLSTSLENKYSHDTLPNFKFSLKKIKNPLYFL